MAAATMATFNNMGGTGTAGGEGGPSTMAYSAMTSASSQPFRDMNGHNPAQPPGPMDNRQNVINQGQSTNQQPFHHLTASVPPLQAFMQHTQNAQKFPLPPQPPRHGMMLNQAQMPNQQFMPPQHLNMGAFPPQIAQPYMNSTFSFGGPPMVVPGQQMPHDMWANHPGNEWDEDRGDYGEGQDMIYGQLEVKHRRRTTPEQLKVLEHWFDINPKPDNNLREWLAMELGMTKRNVQVWFQNRRAKVKGLALKEKAAAVKAAAEASGDSTDASQPGGKGSPTHQPNSQTNHSAPRPSPHSAASQPTVGIMPPVGAAAVNMGRRASLANGEAARMESFIAKQQRLAAAKAGMLSHRSDFVHPTQTAPMLQGQAQTARRKSIPYPAPMDGGSSPKVSPSVRQMPSALHLAAIRNNSRRESLPGSGVQLISSGPFTPPRVVSATGAPGAADGVSNLSTIKDQGGTMTDGFTFPNSDVTVPYLNSPSTYLPDANNAYLGMDATLTGMELGPDGQYLGSYNTSGPLPNPTFSFGAAPPAQNGKDDAMYTQMQPRGRLGSIASVNTVTTDATTALSSQDWDWNIGFGQMPMPDVEGFDPDARRASAPPDLLHNLNYLGLGGNMAMNMAVAPMRPSPLGAFGSEDFASFEMAQNYPGANGTDAVGLFPVFTLDGSTGSSTSPHSFSASSGEPSPISMAKNGGLGMQMTGLHPHYPNPAVTEGYQNGTTQSGSLASSTNQQAAQVAKENEGGNKGGEGAQAKDEYDFFDQTSRDAIKV